MGIFDRLFETKKTNLMTETQKIRQMYAIRDYYKKKKLLNSKLKLKNKK